MLVIVMIMGIAPGLIALLLHTWMNRSRQLTPVTGLLAWFIYSFFILLATYAALYINNRGFGVNWTLQEGSDLFRVGYATKLMLLLLGLAVSLPIAVKILNILKTSLLLALAKNGRSRKFFSRLSNQSPEEDYIVKAVQFFINLSDTDLKKLTSVRHSMAINKGTIGIYSPIYDLKFAPDAGIAVFKTKEEAVDYAFSNHDALLILSNDIADAAAFPQVTRLLVFTNQADNALDDSRQILVPLFTFKDETEKRIENNLLQSLLNQVLIG